MRIRVAIKNDLEKLKELYKEIVYDLNNVKHLEQMQWNEYYPIPFLETYIEKKQMYILEDDMDFIGAFTLHDEEDKLLVGIQYTDTTRFFYVSLLVICPTLQRKGHIKYILNFIKDFAVSNKYKYIRLTVASCNVYAENLYKKLKFNKVEGVWSFENEIYFGYEKKVSDYSAHDLFIIHGYNGDTTETFGEYVKNEAEKLGFAAHMPSFPIRQDGTYENWKEVMDTYFDKEYINENTVIIAHSQGTLFIPKYLAEKNIKIKLFISLAGFLCDIHGRDDINEVIARFRPNKKEVQKSIILMKHRYSIYSDNDHLNPKEELENYADRFNAEKVFIPNMGHMGRKSGVKEIPQIIEIIKSNI